MEKTIDYQDFDASFKEICQLKLLLAEIRMDKMKLVHEQRYELAADLREKELDVIRKLRLIHAQLNDLNEQTELKKETFHQKNNLRKLMNELAFLFDNYEERLKLKTETRIKELKQIQIEIIKSGINEDKRSVVLSELFEKRELLALLNQLLKARTKR
jgi:hypothetical protein